MSTRGKVVRALGLAACRLLLGGATTETKATPAQDWDHDVYLARGEELRSLPRHPS